MRTGNKPVAGQLGVVVKNVVSLRAKPDKDSEQTTQALIGQSVVAEGGQGDWLFVQTWDTYRAWIPTHAVRMLGAKSRPYASDGPVAVMRDMFVDVFKAPSDRAEVITKATVSAELELVRIDEDWAELRLPDLTTGFIRTGEARLINKSIAQTMWLPEPRKLVETAMRFVGTPYLWGGTSPFGLDCSGFVQLVHRIHSVTLLRDAKMQAADERALPVERKDVRVGDLVFFSTKENVVTHVGMAMDNSRFIHACGHSGVIITDFSDPRYSGIYWGARRMRLATLDPGGGAPED